MARLPSGSLAWTDFISTFPWDHEGLIKRDDIYEHALKTSEHSPHLCYSSIKNKTCNCLFLVLTWGINVAGGLKCWCFALEAWLYWSLPSHPKAPQDVITTSRWQVFWRKCSFLALHFLPFGLRVYCGITVGQQASICKWGLKLASCLLTSLWGTGV